MSKSYSEIREALYKKATPDQVDIAEQTDEPASEDEAGMAMDQAQFIGYVAEEIMEYLQGNNDFPEWMQNKLTGFHEKAKDMHAVMAGKYESVQEARFTDKQIKMAYGIANDKRYKGGNYTGAVGAIEKIAKGLSDHPDVKKVLKVTNESLRSDIAKLSAKYPEGSKVRMKHDGKVAKVVSVGKDFVKVAVGNKTMDHKPSELELVSDRRKEYNAYQKSKRNEELEEANYQVKAGKHAIGSASYDDKEIITVTPQQAKKLTVYFQKNKDGDMWKKLFQGGGRGGKGAENQKDFDSMVAGLKESTELDEAAYKVPNNYAAIKARMNKNKKVTDAQINKVLGPTKNAQQGVEALKKAFKVTDDEAKAMIKKVMPTEETVVEATMYLVKMRDGSKHKKTMDGAAAEKMKRNPEVLSVSVIGNVAEESIDMSKAGKYARVMNPKTREIKKVLKTDLRKYVDKGWTHMTQLKNRLTKEVSEAVNFHVRMDHLKDQESKKVVAILQKAEKSGSIKYKGESDKGISFSAKSEPAVNTVTKDIAKVSRVADVEIMEKLEVSDGMGTWIKDFQDSDAPQFKGKSDKERRDMAIAAYMSAKRDMKESATLDEALDSIVAKLMKMKGDAESIANSLTPVQLKDISRNEAEFLRKYKNKNAKEILKLVKDIQG